MRTQVTRWIIRCDRCATARTVDDYEFTGQPPLPEGWEEMTVNGVGYHGYGSRTYELCPVCYAESKDRKDVF